MPFVVRKEYPGGGYPGYVTVTRYESSAKQESFTYHLHLDRATRFLTRDKAVRVQTLLKDPFGTVEVIEL